MEDDGAHACELNAPRPLALSGANDWTLDIENDGLPELRAIWDLYSVPNGVQAFVHPEFEHNFNAHSRRDMYRWFARHLGLDRGLEERPFVPLTREELSAGRFEPTGVGPIRAWMEERTNALLHDLDPEDVFDLAEARRGLGGALQTLVATDLPPNGGVRIQIGKRGSEAGVATAELVLRRRDAGAACPPCSGRPRVGTDSSSSRWG